MRRTKKLVASLFATGVVAAGLAVPSASAQPVITGGLVNITIFDVLNNNDVNVQVPIGIAANVCGINAAVIAHQRSRSRSTARRRRLRTSRLSSGDGGSAAGGLRACPPRL